MQKNPYEKQIITIGVFTLFFSAIILLSGHDAAAKDIKFGSDIDKKTAEISPGGVAVFELSLINSGNDMITVSADAESISPLKTYVIPPKITIPGVGDMSFPVSAQTNIKPKKWYLLNDGVTHVPMYSTYIYAEIPSEIYYTQFHNYTFKVHVTASTKEAVDGSSIKENIAQIHEYELNIILSQDFVNHIKQLDETINLNYYGNSNQNKNIISSSSETDKIEDENSNSVIYLNETQYINDDSRLILPNKISENGNDENSRISTNTSTGKSKAIIDPSTIIVVIVSIVAISIAIRL